MQKELQRTKAVFAVQALWRQHHTQVQNQGKLPQDLQKELPTGTSGASPVFLRQGFEMYAVSALVYEARSQNTVQRQRS